VKGSDIDMRYGWLIAVLVAMLAVQHRDDIKNLWNPPPPITVPAGFQAALYATEWCGYCARTRAFFKENNIAFREFDIEKSDDAHAQFKRLGGNGVPLVLIAEEAIHGYDEGAMRSALKTAALMR
jgi:mycoredoxin